MITHSLVGLRDNDDSQLNWHKSNVNTWVIKKDEIKQKLSIKDQLFNKIFKTLPDFYKTDFLHRTSIYKLLKSLQEFTNNLSLELWSLLKNKFYTLKTKWDVPIIQGNDSKAYFSVQLLEQFGVHPLSDQLTLTIGNKSWVRARNLKTTDEEFNRFIELLNYNKIETVEDYIELQKFVTSGMEMQDVIEELKVKRLTKNCELLVSECNRLNDSLSDNSKISKKQLIELKNMLRLYVTEMDVKLYTQSTLLRAASEDLKRRDPKWNHGFFMQYFDNSAIVAVTQIVYEQIRQLGTDCSLYTIQQFIREQCGRYRVDMRKLVSTAQKIKA